MTNSYKIAERINSDVNASRLNHGYLFFDNKKPSKEGGVFAYCAALTTVPLLNLSNCTNAINMFSGVTLTTTSYSDFLVNLATLSLQSGVSFHGGNSKYNLAAAIARAYLISNFGWTITDGGAA